MTVVLFVIILAALVFVHELGHFLAAKVSGIRVDEFGLGFPPRIVGIKRGETVYSINWIPFGGFVKIFGENPDEESTAGPDKSRSFVHKPKSIQAFVLVAGVTFNALFAWFLLSLGFMIGMPVPAGYSTTAQVAHPQVTIITLVKGDPAEKAGFKEGDILTHLQSGQDAQAITKVDDVQNFIGSHPNQTVAVEYIRSGAKLTANVVPATGIVAERAAIGVSLDEMGVLQLPFFQSVYEGLKLTGFVIQDTAGGLWAFLRQIVVGKAQLSQVTGPVGIAGLVGDAARLGFVYLLSFTAFISINLAVINLIPFPALDGGRLLVTIIEKIKGSAVNAKWINMTNLVGFCILITFMVVVTFHDIWNLFQH